MLINIYCTTPTAACCISSPRSLSDCTSILAAEEPDCIPDLSSLRLTNGTSYSQLILTFTTLAISRQRSDTNQRCKWAHIDEIERYCPIPLSTTSQVVLLSLVHGSWHSRLERASSFARLAISAHRMTTENDILTMLPRVRMCCNCVLVSLSRTSTHKRSHLAYAVHLLVA